ncbi:hypothetical protein CDAR_321561 [Caerostris darwini]|uniref:Uncharacterized protein n=1 Tax=Caerostris darwini TaxID=1538125 RepID=A0AAV4NWV5_9ARAC|nr:hypothetical protein CDAR_321561 [Caerostris darwini]
MIGKCNLKNSKYLKEVLDYTASAEVSDNKELDSAHDCFIDSDNQSVTKGADVSSESSDDEDYDTSLHLTTKKDH